MRRWMTGMAAAVIGAAALLGAEAVATTPTYVVDFEDVPLGPVSLVYTSTHTGPIPVWGFDQVQQVPVAISSVAGNRALGVQTSGCCSRVHVGLGTACGSGAARLYSFRIVGTSGPAYVYLFDRGGNVGPANGLVVPATGTNGATTVTFADGSTGLADDAVAQVAVVFKNGPGYVDDFVFDCIPCDNGEPPPCPPPPTEECDDWFTGGGWILSKTGAKATFGVGGGGKKGQLWGHMNWIDHGTGMHAHWDMITGYTTLAGTRRESRGTCTIDGQSGTYVLQIEDNGEPGRQDWISLELSNGYKAAGTLDGGGNLQLHKANCSTKGGGGKGGKPKKKRRRR